MALVALLAGCGGGGGGGASPSPTPAPPPVDTTPNTFTFPDQSSATRSGSATSGEITVSGINQAAAVSISGGEYSIDGAAFTSAAGTIANNQTIRVRVNTSGQFSTTVSATLTIGGVAATFSVTTADPDTTPDVYTFPAQLNVARGTVIVSPTVTIGGIDSDTPVTITGGEFSINGGTFTSQPGVIANGQTLAVRLTSSPDFSTALGAVVKVGSVQATFSATTLDKDDTPDAYQFARKTNGALGAWVNSDAATISGINVPVAVTVQNGEYSINGGAFTSAAGTISNGQSLVVRARASSVYGRLTHAQVTVSALTADFEVASAVPDYIPDVIVFDSQDAIYLLSKANKLVFKWSLNEARYVDSYVVGLNSQAPDLMAWSDAHHRLYFGYSTGAIQSMDVTAATPAETAFASTPLAVQGLAAAGNFILAQDYSGAWATHYIYDSAGTLKTSAEWNYYSREYAWDAVNSRIYFFRDNMSPDDLHYEVIDQTTGLITGAGETPYHGDYNIQPPIRVTKDGQHVLLGSGDIYRETDLQWSGSLGGAVTDARWFADGSLVQLTTSNNQTSLRRLAANTLTTLEQLPYTGQALRVIGTDTKMAVLLLNNNTVNFQVYVPNDDSDGDGVRNTQDAFPLDAAASVDSDHDGFPDAWNDGKTAADSTTGLSIDAFPQDAACHLDSQGLNGGCNYDAVIPAYLPDQVAQQGDTVYLLSVSNKRVYRWSISQGKYLAPWVVGMDQGYTNVAPTRMAFSAAQHRLYVGYDSGPIHYIDVNDSSAAEAPFANVARGVSTLLAAGNFLLVQDANSYSIQYVYNSSGSITAQTSSSYNYNYNAEFAWDATNSRAYFPSYSYLGYEVIDQQSGQITSAGASPYNSNIYVIQPIRVSANGQYVMVGTGDIFDSSRTFAWAGGVGFQVSDARWMANGSLVTLANNGSQAVLRRLNSGNLTVLEQLPYTGQALRVLGTDTSMVVLANNGGKVEFHTYVPSDDSDGDGINNTQDAFPLDPAASVDTDHDGYPDAWNTGKSQSDSTTGLTLDFFPQDAACHLSSQSINGSCDYGATIPNYLPDQVAQQGDIVYLLSSANKRVYRWSISQARYLSPYVVGVDQGFATVAPTRMAISAAHHRLYLGYASGAIHYIDVNASTPAETAFAATQYPVVGLASVGNYLLSQDTSNNSTLYVYNSSGAIVAQQNYFYYYASSGTDFTWDPVKSRVYSPNLYYVAYQVIDQSSGQITSTGQGPSNYNSYASSPIRVSANGQYVLAGSGDMYDSTNSLNWAGSVGGPVSDARWMANGSIVVLTTSNNQTLLRRLGSGNPTVLEQLTYTGQPLRVVGSDSAMVVLTNNNGAVAFTSYVPNDDGDGDGVANTVDAFPLDPAASVDTDHDGYPDAWNAGKSQADSTTGLTLDAFPNDSACWLPAHGSGGVCNYGATVPNYLPDQVVQQGNIVYLLSSANKRVYRWSMTTNQYLNPYVVGLNVGFSTVAPTTMAYSSAQQRLYLGYSSGGGAVRYIDVNAATPSEVAFANTSSGVNNLASAGNYLYVYAAGGYLFNSAGTVTDQGQAQSSRDYGWDAITSRLYYFRDGTSPNDLQYVEVNQSTGKFGAAGETPYHGAYNIVPPIRVSNGGQYVVLGSGDIYNQNGLTWAGSVGTQFADGRWFADGSLVILTTSGNQSALRHLGSTNLSTLELITYTGQALRVVGSDSKMVVITSNNGAVQFTSYVPSNDSDGDGVPNTSDAFPTDPAASVDTDNDGYPDSWNAGKSQADSTTGLTLDAFPNDSACWLSSHGSGGVCNYGATIPNYTPDQVVVQGNTVYLLSTANKRVYRWSIATGQYLNPYVVGINQGFSSIAPTHMAYSAAHQRLYLAYDTGAIHYIDVTGSPVETSFANTAMGVGGIVAAGNYVVAQDSSGAWATHYVINSAGVITDQVEWNYYSREYAWDANTSRIYFFRDDTSPDDLQYEVIDQATGKITGAGETPYHGDYSIVPPIRVSADGGLILLGSGDIYEKTGLTNVGSLGKQIADARWRSNILVDVDSTDQLEIRDSSSRAVMATYQYLGTPVAIAFGTTEAYLVHIAGGTTAFVRLPFYDQDGDGMPKWWEQKYGLNDNNAADAALDADSDGVSNLLEYQNHSNPLLADTDGDGLTDLQEISTTHTDPSRVDTDGDNLSDFDEYNRGTDPLDADTDNDGYTDDIEVEFGGNPTDVGVVPVPLTSYSQTFEAGSDLTLWSNPTPSQAAWAVDTTTSHLGARSFKAGAVGNSQTSSTRLRGFFRPGTLTFYARMDGYSCCDRLVVVVDGTVVNQVYYPTSWSQMSINLAVGVHDIEWRYQRDSYDYGNPPETAWIDDVVFTGQ